MFYSPPFPKPRPASPPPQPPPSASITIDAAAVGRVFQGIGGVSASSSRRLYDYDEDTRSAILDMLFLPAHGAALHHLKVEIGGDGDSVGRCAGRACVPRVRAALCPRAALSTVCAGQAAHQSFSFRPLTHHQENHRPPVVRARTR